MIMIPMYSELSSPIYYENELRAYEHEIEVCPDSLDYSGVCFREEV